MKRYVVLCVILAVAATLKASGQSVTTNQTDQAMTKLNDRIAAVERKLNAPSDPIKEHIAKLEARLDKISAKLGDNFERNSYSSFDTLERKLEDMARRLDKLERAQDDMDRQLRNSGSRR